MSALPEPSDRDWVDDFKHENGKYINTCMYCKSLFYGHKRRVVCHKCATIPDLEKVEVKP